MDKFSELKAAAMAATPGPWEWFTSNSMARLSSIPSGKDGDVLSAFRASDGVPCVSVSQPDMAFIAAANPAVVLALLDRIAELEAKTEMTMGVGSGNGNLFVHGDYDSIKAAQAIVLENESLRAKLATPVRSPDDGLDDCRDMWPSDCSDDFDTGYKFGLWSYEQNIRAAGFTVEGDE